MKGGKLVQGKSRRDGAGNGRRSKQIMEIYVLTIIKKKEIEIQLLIYK